MAVAYDNSPVATTGYDVTGLTSASFTIGSNSDRAAVVGLVCNSGNAQSDTFTGSCGGASVTVYSQLFENLWLEVLAGCVAPSSGSQTASMSWQTSSGVNITMTTMTFDGAAQTSTFDGVQTDSTDFDSTSLSVSITSDSGDMTASVVGCGVNVTTNQTERSNYSDQDCGDTGPGTGSTTHTWSKDGAASHRGIMVGVNINQAAGTTPGSVCWGHDTSVTEDNTRDFSGNWSGTGSVVSSGDNEYIQLASGQYMESETWNFGNRWATIVLDDYGTGYGTVSVDYKDGTSEANCNADTWHDYTVPFLCSGWLKIRIDA